MGKYFPFFLLLPFLLLHMRLSKTTFKDRFLLTGWIGKQRSGEQQSTCHYSLGPIHSTFPKSLRSVHDKICCHIRAGPRSTRPSQGCLEDPSASKQGACKPSQLCALKAEGELPSLIRLKKLRRLRKLRKFQVFSA